MTLLSREALTLNITVDDSVTQNVCNVGKSRKPNLDMRGICTENPASQPESFTQN
jgi:hypothetical protein